MQLDRLCCLNYRNIADCELNFSPKFNCFLGRNGMGKTNALDAIYYLSITKSHIALNDMQVVRHEQPLMMLEGAYDIDGRAETIQASVRTHSKKVVKRNGKPYQRMADHIGLIPVVLISPLDQCLINDGSDERRRFMNIVISQFDPRYLGAVSRYNYLLRSRNDLLKSMAEGVSTDESATLLEVLDLQMEREAEYVHAKRAEFTEQFLPYFAEIYGRISGAAESVQLTYSSHLEDGKGLSELLREVHARDITLGYTTRGIHKDDLKMTIDGYPIRSTGSQGQNKTFVVALKLAQYQYMARERGRQPLLLLDDLFDRLDSGRVANIIDLVSSDEYGQIFITDTSRNYIDELFRGRESAIFEVNAGIFSRI